ncbi:MAG TPA: protease pro-enzyme activation domain-containing protein, partial [bacterium]|nr:protease pro-enzyme activation domain-containing protein [bacterium]
MDRQADRLPSSQTLHLSLGLALPQPDALKQFLSDVYNPASPNFRHFLKPGDFARRFGPSEADYQSVIAFAQGHGLKVNQTYPNRLVVSVSGPASAVEQAFNVRLFHYRHRDQSLFFAPDAEPSIDSALPIQHIGGLDNAVVPRPPLLQAGAAPQNIIIPSTGAGPFNTYISKDFRAAYAPGVPETGQGQSVALVEFDAGYEPSDIATYESVSGLAPVPLQNRLIGGYDGGTGSAEVEVALDVELAIAMAPGLSSVLVYEGGGTDELFNQIAVDDQALQTSVSWLYGSDATTDVIFQQMAAQGQSVFNAAGDWGSIQSNPGIYSYSIVGDPNITFVGGTLLGTTGPGGAWAQETTWMPGGGGISSYPIPSYQQSLPMAVNQGSTSLRNIPDVALTANYVLEVEEGSQFGQGGTSAATPLWAAFMALANQHAASLGLPAVGAANPAIYNIAKSPYYARDFHDIQDLSTNNPANPSQFSAVTGYDLATGWGSPNGAGLVADLSNPGVQRPSPGPSLTPSQTFTPTYTPTPAPTLVAAACGTNITVDGLLGDAAWAGPFTPVTKLVLGANNDSEAGYYKVRWDSQYLYVGFLVSPSSLFPAPQSLPWTGEAVELYLDMGNNRSASYEA